MQGLAFTLYDLIAYFVPGALMLLSIMLLADRAQLNTASLTTLMPEIPTTVILLALIYAMGHVLHALSNLTLDRLNTGGYPPGDYFPNNFAQDFPEPFRTLLYEKITSTFGIKESHFKEQNLSDEEKVNLTIKSSYWACYATVAQRQSNPLVQVFGSLSGFYRGLSVANFMTALLYLIGAVALAQLSLIIVSVLTIGLGFLFQNRNHRFRRYLAQTVYSDFLSPKEKKDETK